MAEISSMNKDLVIEPNARKAELVSTWLNLRLEGEKAKSAEAAAAWQQAINELIGKSASETLDMDAEIRDALKHAAPNADALLANND
eukprot:5027351-Alexandrium_andersonii.AAC.1